MLEIVILAVIVVGLYRKHGESWEWSRPRLHRAFGGLAKESDRAVERTRRSFPQLLAQCIEDVRSLFLDLTGVLQPSVRRRLHRGTHALLNRSPGSGRAQALETVPASGGVMAEKRAPGERAYARLQRRYLDGRIDLDEYMEEAERLERESREP